MSNVMTALAMSIMGWRPAVQRQWLGLCVLMLSMERNCTTKAVATKRATSGGAMQSGEFQACFGNMRSIITIAAPLMYGAAYNMGIRGVRGVSMPGLPYFLCAGLIGVSQLVLWSVPRAAWEESDSK
jgi:hypothetical protein